MAIVLLKQKPRPLYLTLKCVMQNSIEANLQQSSFSFPTAPPARKSEEASIVVQNDQNPLEWQSQRGNLGWKESELTTTWWVQREAPIGSWLLGRLLIIVCAFSQKANLIFYLLFLIDVLHSICLFYFISTWWIWQWFLAW